MISTWSGRRDSNPRPSPWQRDPWVTGPGGDDRECGPDLRLYLSTSRVTSRRISSSRGLFADSTRTANTPEPRRREPPNGRSTATLPPMNLNACSTTAGAYGPRHRGTGRRARERWRVSHAGFISDPHGRPRLDGGSLPHGRFDRRPRADRRLGTSRHGASGALVTCRAAHDRRQALAPTTRARLRPHRSAANSTPAAPVAHAAPGRRGPRLNERRGVGRARGAGRPA